VTDADIVSQRVILEGLRAATPDIPVFAEELSWDACGSILSVFWLVDPLDGHGNLPVALMNSSSMSRSFAITREIRRSLCATLREVAKHRSAPG
jgi:hypothetical protein